MGELDEKALEAAARAIYQDRNGHGCTPWSIRPRAHREPYLSDARAAITAYLEASPSGWKTMESCPRDGSHFLAYIIDLVDEYDEDERLIARAKPTPGIIIAYNFDLFGGARLDLVQYPWTGSMPQGRSFQAWCPLPLPPSPNQTKPQT